MGEQCNDRPPSDKLQTRRRAINWDSMFGKRLHREKRWWVRLGGAASGVVAIVIVACGCGHDTRLSGKKIPSARVRTVTHYDIVLDQNATPEQVAYVALRAMREDFFAQNPAEREAALIRQFELCAANEIAERNRTGLPRDEFIYNVVYRWTPTVSHYAADLPTDWESASRRLVRRAPKPVQGGVASEDEAEVALEVRRPGEDAAAGVVLLVWLVKDEGYWRVTHPGFDRKSRSLTPPAASAGGAVSPRAVRSDGA